ncbi:MAG TPA: hypothetical protein VI322_05395 [Candidatus Saccharimonadia bacterium]
MKKRDLVYLLIAVTIFLVAGYLAYTQLMPKSSAKSKGTVDVELVGVVPSTFDGAGLQAIKNEGSVTTLDFNSQPDLSGLGNKAPFGQ